MKRCWWLILFIAALPQTVEYSTYQEWKKGEWNNLQISSEGVVELAYAVEVIFSEPERLIWSLIPDGMGNLIIGFGNDGKIAQLDSSGKEKVLYQAPETEIFALALHPRGDIFAASSPDGKVYRITGPEKAEVFFDPAEKYIWALHWDKQKKGLWVATGESAKLYFVTISGEVKEVFTPKEKHLRSIALGGKGEVYVGTDDTGIIYRIDDTGKSFALADTAYQEIVQLQWEAGKLYALAGSAPAIPAAPTEIMERIPAEMMMQDSAEMQMMEQFSAEMAERAGEFPVMPPGRPPKKQAAFLEVDSDGTTYVLWQSSIDEAFAFSALKGNLYAVATGNAGKLYGIDPLRKEWLLLSLAEPQITRIATTPTFLFLVTNNPTKIYRGNLQIAQEGEWTSPVFDANSTSLWGKIMVIADIPQKSSVELFTRSGNVENPDETWSGWQAVKEGQILSPPARFLQFKIRLKSSGDSSPVVHYLSVVYQPKNLPPTITMLQISPVKPRTPALPPTPTDMTFPSAPQTAEEVPPPEAMFRPAPKGQRTITWKADDPNRDSLEFSLYYKLLSENRWKLLKDKITAKRHAWDTLAVPDGIYQIKLQASDAPSSPPELALTAEWISTPFLVDNSPPSIQFSHSSTSKGSIAVHFTVSDALSVIEKVEYALDGGSWVVILPEDGIADSREETFTLNLTVTEPGEHSIVIRATDASQNFFLASISLSISS